MIHDEEFQQIRDHVEALDFICRYLMALMATHQGTDYRATADLMIRLAEQRLETPPFMSNGAVQAIRNLAAGGMFPIP